MNFALSWSILRISFLTHYNDVIMGVISSHIISLTIVYSTVYSDADQSKHQSSASLAFVRGIDRDRWIPRTKGQLRGKCFHLMTSSCNNYLSHRPFSQCSSHRIITTFLGLITNVGSDGHAKKIKVRGPRSRSQRSNQILPQFSGL